MSNNNNRTKRVMVSNVEAANTGTSLLTIAADDTLITNRAGTVLTGGGNTILSNEANDRIMVSLGLGSTPANSFTSTEIPLKGITKVTVRGYSAPAAEVQTYGYDGTTGALPAPDDLTEYAFNILIKDDQRIHGNKPSRQFYTAITDSSSTAKELAFLLVNQVQKDPASLVKAEVLTNGTFTALTSDGATTVVTGSRVVISPTHGYTVGGAYVRLGASNATTTAVYIVDQVIDANVFTIKGAFQGPTSTTANAGTITADTVVGIRLTGKDIDYSIVNNRYETVNFDSSIYATTSINMTVFATPTLATPLTLGNGYWKQVKQEEYDNMGYKGLTNVIGWPGNILNNQSIFRTVEGNTYNVVCIEYNSIEPNGMQTLDFKPQTLEVAFYSSTAPTPSTKQTNFITTLNGLCVSVGVKVS